jgi:two-component system phosphate regulon sensor histidine kinase PhoR
MVSAASYVIMRAISREMAVARLQSDFVAAVSHEFRTPLTSLRQFTEMLRDNPGLDEERRRLAYDAQSRSTDRLIRLVESLLDFGRMEAGEPVGGLSTHDCTTLVGAVVDEVRDESAATGQLIEFHASGPAMALIDPDALARAVRNLLDNALKYSPDRGPVAVAVATHAGEVAISVSDHGIGVPAHERSAIFAKFQRGAQARLRGIKGTGIGLAMVSEIVRAHRGRVDMDSTVNVGSTFTIVLPTAEADGLDTLAVDAALTWPES